MCGPHGTQFLKPVELRLPHCASMTPDGWSFALKSSDTPTGRPTRHVPLPSGDTKAGECVILVGKRYSLAAVARARRVSECGLFIVLQISH